MKYIRTVLAATLSLSCSLAGAQAAEYPDHAIRMLVGFSAGSISDNTARAVAAEAEKTLGQPIVVENVPGAGATLAAARAAKAPADGYTILFAAMGHAVAPALYSKLPYDTVNDFTGVASVADARVMLVTQPKYEFKTVVDFIKDAKANPGKYTFGSSGNGTFLHLIGESLAQDTGIELLHIPYRAGSEVVTAVMSGNVDVAFCTVNTCLENVRAGKLKALGYIAKKRHPSAPEIPTFAELGLDFDVSSYNYLLAPAGTPEPVLRKLHKAFNDAVNSPAMVKRFHTMGLDPVPSESPEAVTEFVKSEVNRWGPLVKGLGLQVD